MLFYNLQDTDNINKLQTAQLKTLKNHSLTTDL